jgi:hypothetical protein
MFGTTVKIVSTLIVVAAVAVPTASGNSRPRTPSVGQGFSLGVPLEYQSKPEPTHATEGFSLGVPLEYQSKPEPTHATEGFSLGVPLEYQAQPVASARGDSFDWLSAAIGAGAVAGAFLLVGAGGVLVIRTRQSRGAASHV